MVNRADELDRLPRVRIPQTIIEQLTMLCDEHSLGMTVTGIPGVTFILVAAPGITPNQAVIMAAHQLLEGVVTDRWNEVNAQAKTAEEANKGTVN